MGGMKQGKTKHRVKSLRGRDRFDITPATARSAVANGSRLLDGLDGRSAPARRYRDLAFSIASDIGGMDNISEAERQLVRSLAGLVVLRERLDALALGGEQIDTAEYCRLVNSIRRTAATIGLEVRVVDGLPTVEEYAREVAEEGAAA